jgi:type 1 glutamine amidotransferase
MRFALPSRSTELRSSKMSHLGLLLFCLALLGPAWALSDVRPKPIRALLVTGGCCHPYGEQADILVEGTSSRAKVAWTVVNQGGTATGAKIPLYEQADWAHGFDVVVHNECFADVDDVEWVKRITQPHYQGVAAVVIHCAMHSYRSAKTDVWHQFLGVESHRHEKSRAFEIVNQKPSHSIMKEFPARWRTPSEDELYIIDRLMPQTEALGEAYGAESAANQVCVWTNQYGKGRVFGVTTGHFSQTLRDPDYLALITRGLLWATGKLDDAGKPMSGYDSDAR